MIAFLVLFKKCNLLFYTKAKFKAGSKVVGQVLLLMCYPVFILLYRISVSVPFTCRLASFR